jgi:hypothetical protein
LKVGKIGWAHVVMGASLFLSGSCRFSYELLGDEAARGPTGDGDISFAGASGDGDQGEGDGDSDIPGDGDGGDGDGDGDGDISGDGDGGDGDISGDGDVGDGDASTGGASASGGSGGAIEGSGGASTGGESGSGGQEATGGDTGSGGAGSGGAMGTYHVTTNSGDGSPGSFRAAVDAAMAAGTPASITFEPDLVITMSEKVPTTSSDIEILGNNTHLDFSSLSGNPDCFFAIGGTLVLDGLEISGCPNNPIVLSASVNSQITNCYIHDNGGYIATGTSSSGTVIGPDNVIVNSGGHGLFLNAAGDVVIDNQIFDSTGSGVYLSGTADSSSVIGNLIVRSNVGIQFASGTTGTSVFWNTIATTSGNCITVGQATGIDIRNNIISYCGIYGVVGAQANLAALTHNLFFQNGTAHCSQCTPGTGSLVDVDPLFTDFAGDNFFPALGSPVIDAGVDITGVDRNRSGPGNSYGLAPDIGYVETNY